MNCDFCDFEENLGISEKNRNTMLTISFSDFTGIPGFSIKFREKRVETIKIAKCDFALFLQWKWKVKSMIFWIFTLFTHFHTFYTFPLFLHFSHFSIFSHFLNFFTLFYFSALFRSFRPPCERVALAHGILMVLEVISACWTKSRILS